VIERGVEVEAEVEVEKLEEGGEEGEEEETLVVGIEEGSGKSISLIHELLYT
jgi:hypothetical protein